MRVVLCPHSGRHYVISDAMNIEKSARSFSVSQRLRCLCGVLLPLVTTETKTHSRVVSRAIRPSSSKLSPTAFRRISRCESRCTAGPTRHRPRSSSNLALRVPTFRSGTCGVDGSLGLSNTCCRLGSRSASETNVDGSFENIAKLRIRRGRLRRNPNRPRRLRRHRRRRRGRGGGKFSVLSVL